MNSLPWEISVQETRDRLAEPGSIVLIDCREPDEFAIAKIDGAQLVPMSEMMQRFGELETHRQSHIVVHCHHGGRSMRVTQALRARGFERVQSMAGGIDAWSQEIDPTVARY